MSGRAPGQGKNFYFGHITFEVPVRYPNSDSKMPKSGIQEPSLTRNINLRGLRIQIFKVLKTLRESLLL